MSVSSTPTVPVIRSDHLRIFRSLAAAYPVLSQLLKLYRVRLIVDANIIIGDVRWLARRRTPGARTALQEAIAAGTIVAFAPPELEEDVREKLPRIAADDQIELARLEAEWEGYRGLLRFRTPGPGKMPEWVQDPDDLPYLFLHAEIGADAILTRDTDIAAMGGDVIDVGVVLALRDYSRGASVQAAIHVGGTVVTLGGLIVIRQVWRILRLAVSAFGQLPGWLKVTAALALIGALLHPRGREFLRNAAVWLPEHIGPLFDVLTPMLDQLVSHATESRQLIDSAAQRIGPLVAASRPRTARVHARRACLEAQGPLALEELARRVIEDGYVTRSRDFPSYLRRVLRTDREFVESPRGQWTLRSGLVVG